jgi:uncharacterized protein (TIGR00730 family)
MTITVYLGASPGSDQLYREAVKELGTWIGRNGHDLVYGGSHSGLMGLLADAALEAGAHVTGVEPRFFIDAQIQHTGIDDLIVVETMSERRDKIIELGEAFIAFPGGVGTLDEISEIIVLKTLGRLDKPCVIYNINGYYKLLEAFFDHMVDEGFLSEARRAMVSFVESVDELNRVLAPASE